LYRAELAIAYGALSIPQRHRSEFDAALLGFTKARDLLRELSREHPETVKHRQDLAITIANMAETHVLSGRPAQAIPLYGESRSLLEGLAAKNPKNPTWRAPLGEIWEETGHALEALGRNEDAVAAYRQAIEWQHSADKLGPPARPYLGVMLRHAEALSRLQRSLGQVDESMATVFQHRSLGSGDPVGTFQAAVEFARCIPLAATNESSTARRSDIGSKNCADLAVETLNEAIDLGFCNVTKLVEPAFEPLRSREDFQRSVMRVMDLAFPSNPFVPL
jgi:tetratricopeptide (TPR) repeat protein